MSIFSNIKAALTGSSPGVGTSAMSASEFADMSPIIKAQAHPSAGHHSFNHTAMMGGNIFGADASEGVDANRDRAALVAVDQLFSSGWLTGLVDAAIAQIIGDGLKLNVKPNAELLGWTQERANDFAKQVESLFSLYAGTPSEVDNAGRQSFASMQRTLMRSYFGAGEGLAIYPFRKTNRQMFGSKVQLLDPCRLDSSVEEYGTDRDGLFYKDGRPEGVVIKDRDPATGSEDWQARKIPFYSKSGKPMATLAFDSVTPQQRRGITPLFSVLRLIKQYEKLHGASLALTQLYTMLGVTITSNATSEDVANVLSNGDSDAQALADFVATKQSWYSQQKNMFGGFGADGHVPVTHLLPGETLDLKSIPAGADNLAEFSKLLKLEITRALGAWYSLSGDYDGSTYSSSRMEIAANWPLVLQRRKNIVEPFCDAVFQAWLEEVILRGLIVLPGGVQQFYAMRPAFRANWTGPSMPQADEQKSTRAIETRLATGVTSLARECSGLGLDWQEVLEQRAREKEYAEKLGLPDPHVKDPDPATLQKPQQLLMVTENNYQRAVTFDQAVALLNDKHERLERMKPPTHQNFDDADTIRMRNEGYRQDKRKLEAEIQGIEDVIEEYQS